MLDSGVAASKLRPFQSKGTIVIAASFDYREAEFNAEDPPCRRNLQLFRHFYALPSARGAEEREVAAVRGVLTSTGQCGRARAGGRLPPQLESLPRLRTQP
jgi:hypothetical protein